MVSDGLPCPRIAMVAPTLGILGGQAVQAKVLADHLRAEGYEVLLVPINYAWMAWGWPNRFLARMRDAGTEVYAIGPHAGGGFTTGSDTALEVGQLPEGYNGGIWTNRIQAIAPLVAGNP